MEIVVITIGSYPYGEAATNRHLSYLRGLSENNNNVKLLSLAPSNNQSLKSNLKKTEYYGVKIKYLSPFLYVNSKIVGYFNFIMGAILGLFHLITRNINFKKKKILILLVTSPFILLPFSIIGKFLGYKIVHERTEYPFIGNHKKPSLNFYQNYIIPKFDGIFVITNALREYFEKFTNKKVYVLPMSVESGRFDSKKELSNNRYIAYCGSMYSDKDGVPDLIKSFNIVAEKNNAVKLYLIGDNRDSQKFKIISDAINESPFKNRIVCTGFIDRDNIPKLLINAEILALSRPDNIQAKGGFPTKLGEYLSTGNPVVITDVGEHSIYLENLVSALIVSPGNPLEFAQKILFLLDNPDRAKKIGLMGKKTAHQYFDYKSQSENLQNYFNEI